MGSILLTFLPIITVVMIGYLFSRSGLFTENVGVGLVQFVYWLAIPAMLFLHMFQTNISESIPLTFLLSFYVPSICVFLVGMIVFNRVFGWDAKELGVAGIVSSYGNLALLGLPILLAVTNDQDALLPALVLLATQSTILFTLTIVALNGLKGLEKNAFREVFYRLATNPIVLALILGLAFNMFQIPLNVGILYTLNILGDAAPGCALVALGASLGTYELRKPGKEVLCFVLLRNFAHPLLVWGVALFFGLDGAWLTVAVLFAAMPVGINAFVFAESYGIRQSTVSVTLVVSTLISTATIPILLYLLPL
jgi:malonate transporter and related proteins